MTEQDPFGKQEIDPRLMNSLGQLDASEGQSWFFPDTKGKKSSPPVPVAPSPTPKPQAVHASQQPSSSTTAPIPNPITNEPGAVRATQTGFANSLPEKHSQKHRLLFIPIALIFLMTVASVVLRFLNAPYLSRGTESVIYLMLALLASLCFIALTLYYLGELRERYVFSASTQPSSTKDIFIAAILFVAWPVVLAVVSATIFMIFLGDELMLGTVNGLSTVLFLTAPLTLTLAVIIFWVLTIYKKTTLIPYPPFVHEAISFVWEKLK